VSDEEYLRDYLTENDGQDMHLTSARPNLLHSDDEKQIRNFNKLTYHGV
jgi:hypothetical protein